MYRCQMCHKPSKPKEKLNRRVTQTRPRMYKYWDHNEEKELQSKGTEIVKEIGVCNDCKDKELPSIFTVKTLVK